ncbi:MAG: hypothetical protein K1X50_16695 [Candidatus Promineofilum sp.]|nr:hypothetical protein [Promineifilum sp.]MCW5864562.1 hypothetical protein [Anaerolineae bacterium]
MRKAALYLAIFLVLLLAPLAVRLFQYYDPLAEAPATPPAYTGAGIGAVPTPEAGNGADTVQTGAATQRDTGAARGVVVLDQAHGNQFTREELATLDGLLAARGLRVQPLAEGELTEALRAATALVVVAPVNGYSPAEAQAVSDLVARGGRVLLVGDPTRYNIEIDEADIFAAPIIATAQVPLNDLANAFDITFRGDYLYNTVENEGNFRNILVGGDGLGDSALTERLERLALYSSHSLQLGPSAAALLSADDNTWSSATDRPGGLVLAALSPAASDAGQLLAIGDVHFLTEPYSTVYDNGAFVARVADFLAGGRGSTDTLAGFPYFFHSPIDLVYSDDPELGPDAFDDIIALQAAFRGAGLALALADEADDDHDALYVGLYNTAADVAELLDAAGVSLAIRPAIARPAITAATDPDATPTPSHGTRLVESPLGDVEMAGTALLLLADDGARRQLVVLAASNDGLESALERLRGAASAEGVNLTDCLIQDNLALCPTGVANEPVEYELDTSGPAEEPTTEPEQPDEDQEDTTAPIDKGRIALGETKTAELAAEEIHAWTFDGGPATINIAVDPDTDMDAVLELYAPNGTLMANLDSAFAGGVEEMRGVEIPDDGQYFIVVRDFFNDGGHYQISIAAGEPAQPEPTTEPGG